MPSHRQELTIIPRRTVMAIIALCAASATVSACTQSKQPAASSTGTRIALSCRATFTLDDDSQVTLGMRGINLVEQHRAAGGSWTRPSTIYTTPDGSCALRSTSQQRGTLAATFGFGPASQYDEHTAMLVRGRGRDMWDVAAADIPVSAPVRLSLAHDGSTATWTHGPGTIDAGAPAPPSAPSGPASTETVASWTLDAGFDDHVPRVGTYAAGGAPLSATFSAHPAPVTLSDGRKVAVGYVPGAGVAMQRYDPKRRFWTRPQLLFATRTDPCQTSTLTATRTTVAASFDFASLCWDGEAPDVSVLAVARDDLDAWDIAVTTDEHGWSGADPTINHSGTAVDWSGTRVAIRWKSSNGYSLD